MYDCRQCDEERRKAYGCEEESECMVWETDSCFNCRGFDSECKYCEGTDRLQVKRCPRALSGNVIELIPYFTDWRVSNRVVWPNGEPRLHQPCKLAEAFDLLDDYVQKAIENESKSTSNSGSHKQRV